MFKFLKGKKTYLVAAAGVAYAALGVATGHTSPGEAIQLAVTSILGATIRNGLPAS